MPAAIDQLMETASEALGRMDYLACEALCLEALATARAQGNWAYYARVLMPLQESRRQRRMIATEGVVRLGTADLDRHWSDWPEAEPSGCIVLTHPHTPETARTIEQNARQQRRCVEVLFADNASCADTWAIRSFAGPAVTCHVPAPPVAWRDRWLASAEVCSTKTVKGSMGPADWFLDACEALGDVALAQVEAPRNSPERIEALEQCLAVVTDHEVLHQRLGDAARALRA